MLKTISRTELKATSKVACHTGNKLPVASASCFHLASFDLLLRHTASVNEPYRKQKKTYGDFAWRLPTWWELRASAAQVTTWCNPRATHIDGLRGSVAHQFISVSMATTAAATAAVTEADFSRSPSGRSVLVDQSSSTCRDWFPLSMLLTLRRSDDSNQSWSVCEQQSKIHMKWWQKLRSAAEFGFGDRACGFSSWLVGVYHFNISVCLLIHFELGINVQAFSQGNMLMH